MEPSTIELAAPFRRARSEDAAQMAELVNMAGDGLPVYLWTQFARPGQSAGDVGLEQARLGLGGFAPHNTVVREEEGSVAACLIGYPSGDSPKPADTNLPAPLVPLEELGELARGTWYLNVLATFPQYRGRGYADELLRIAERLARESGNARISLIASDANTGALRLYAKNGFTEQARQAMVKENWVHSGRDWLLFVKDL